MSSTERRARVLDETSLGWAKRAVWIVSVAVYLTTFIGGIQAGGSDLMTLGRAAGFTLAAAILGRIGLDVLGRASLPLEQGPSADQEGPFGSLAGNAPSANVAQQDELAGAA